MQIKGTPYSWEGLLDNAIHACNEIGFTFTAGMIKRNLPDLVKEFESIDELRREVHRLKIVEQGLNGEIKNLKLELGVPLFK